MYHISLENKEVYNSEILYAQEDIRKGNVNPYRV